MNKSSLSYKREPTIHTICIKTIYIKRLTHIFPNNDTSTKVSKKDEKRPTKAQITQNTKTRKIKQVQRKAYTYTERQHTSIIFTRRTGRFALGKVEKIAKIILEKWKFL
ncbi:MAG: hypothetical protein MJZ24_11325, partial [Paludibacteraceae bacterium]|nr:hypothetical protein [Paludibacteraceae bacterium]